MDWLISIFIYEGLPNILNRKIFSLACYYRGFVHTLKKWLLFLVKKCCVNTLERNFYWHFSSRCIVEWTIPYSWIFEIPRQYNELQSILYPCNKIQHVTNWSANGQSLKYHTGVIWIQPKLKSNFYKKIQISWTIDKLYGIVTVLNCHA